MLPCAERVVGGTRHNRRITPRSTPTEQHEAATAQRSTEVWNQKQLNPRRPKRILCPMETGGRRRNRKAAPSNNDVTERTAINHQAHIPTPPRAVPPLTSLKRYASDLMLPFGAYFLLSMNELHLGFLRKWHVKALIVFSVMTFSEILQLFGVYFFGGTFDMVDILISNRRSSGSAGEALKVLLMRQSSNRLTRGVGALLSAKPDSK